MARTSCRVGLTGGIASGKSTVGRFMSELGCTVTDADRLVDELYAPKERGSELIAEFFGEGFLLENGAVNKPALAHEVFEDHQARRKLEQLIHPLIAQRFEDLARVSSGIVVFEATLLVETGGYRRFDKLVTVEADPALRLRRAIERGSSPDQAQARIAAQASEPERVEVADFVIRNEAGLEQLRDATAAVVAKLEADADFGKDLGTD